MDVRVGNLKVKKKLIIVSPNLLAKLLEVERVKLDFDFVVFKDVLQL